MVALRDFELREAPFKRREPAARRAARSMCANCVPASVQPARRRAPEASFDALDRIQISLTSAKFTFRSPSSQTSALRLVDVDVGASPNGAAARACLRHGPRYGAGVRKPAECEICGERDVEVLDYNSRCRAAPRRTMVLGQTLS